MPSAISLAQAVISSSVLQMPPRTKHLPRPGSTYVETVEAVPKTRLQTPLPEIRTLEGWKRTLAFFFSFKELPDDSRAQPDLGTTIVKR